MVNSQRDGVEEELVKVDLEEELDEEESGQLEEGAGCAVVVPGFSAEPAQHSANNRTVPSPYAKDAGSVLAVEFTEPGSADPLWGLATPLELATLHSGRRVIRARTVEQLVARLNREQPGYVEGVQTIGPVTRYFNYVGETVIDGKRVGGKIAWANENGRRLQWGEGSGTFFGKLDRPEMKIDFGQFARRVAAGKTSHTIEYSYLPPSLYAEIDEFRHKLSAEAQELGRHSISRVFRVERHGVWVICRVSSSYGLGKVRLTPKLKKFEPKTPSPWAGLMNGEFMHAVRELANAQLRPFINGNGWGRRIRLSPPPTNGGLPVETRLAYSLRLTELVIFLCGKAPLRAVAEPYIRALLASKAVPKGGWTPMHLKFKRLLRGVLRSKPPAEVAATLVQLPDPTPQYRHPCTPAPFESGQPVTLVEIRKALNWTHTEQHHMELNLWEPGADTNGPASLTMKVEGSVLRLSPSDKPTQFQLMASRMFAAMADQHSDVGTLIAALKSIGVR